MIKEEVIKELKELKEKDKDLTNQDALSILNIQALKDLTNQIRSFK